MTLGNMRERGVHHLIEFCLNDACLEATRLLVWYLKKASALLPALARMLLGRVRDHPELAYPPRCRELLSL
jgi:hypothetical protein